MTHHTCIHIPQAPGRHPQPFPISSSPYTAPFPVRSYSPPQLFLCLQRPTCMRLTRMEECKHSKVQRNRNSLFPKRGKLEVQRLEGTSEHGTGTLREQPARTSAMPIGLRDSESLARLQLSEGHPLNLVLEPVHTGLGRDHRSLRVQSHPRVGKYHCI